MFGSYPTLKIQNSNNNQYASASIDLQYLTGDERYTTTSGNSNAGGTETYFQIEQYDSSGSYVRVLLNIVINMIIGISSQQEQED